MKTILILTLVIGYDEWMTVRTGLFPFEENLTEEEWKEEEEQWALYSKARRNEQARFNYHKRTGAL